MRRLNNEQGFTLIVVSLLIVLIMGFSTFFMSNAISNAKQEQTVDKNNLTVAIAEMGVDYYSNALLNKYYTLIPDLEQYIDNELKETKDSSKAEDIENILNRIQIDIAERLINEMESMNNDFLRDESENLEVINGYTYNLIGPVSAGELEVGMDNEKKFTITGEVEGKNMESGDFEVLTFNQTFYVPDFSLGISNIPGDHITDEIEDGLKPIVKPNKLCEKGKEFEGDCYVNGNYSIPKKGNNKLLDSILWVSGNLDTTQGNRGHPPIIKHSQLYVGGNLTIGNNFVPESSQIYVAGNLDIGPGNTFNVIGKTKICVAGSIFNKNKELKHDVPDNVVYALNPSYEDKGVNIVKDIDTLKRTCGVIDPSEPTLPIISDYGWIKPTIEVSY